jgi:glycosyltransferase involved in cell wall biosynthesis
VKILVATFSFPDPAIGSYDGRFVLSETVGYAQNGASVLVLTPHYPGALRDEVFQPGIRVHRFRYWLPERLQRLKIPGQPIYRAGSLLALVQIPLILVAMALAILHHARIADLIHAQWTITGLLALPAKWLYGTPVVITARGSDLRLLPAWLNRWLHRQVDAAIDCFGPQPWNLAYKAANPARYLVLPLIVDTGDPHDLAPELDTVRDDPQQPLIVLYIGRFDRIKIETNRLPLFDLIEAVAILKVQGTAVSLFYVGDGEATIGQCLREAIAQFDVADRVTLLGPRSQVAPYVRSCHLGVGGIALNGVAQDFTVNAKPQVLMDTEDNADTPWRDGVNALLVAPSDPQSLAARLLWAGRHRIELAGIGEQARVDLARLMTDTQDGGRRYLDAFRALIRD